MRRRRRNHQTNGERRQREELLNTLDILENKIQQIIDKLGDDTLQNISGASSEQLCKIYKEIDFHETIILQTNKRNI
jgi:hypothetical protein